MARKLTTEILQKAGTGEPPLIWDVKVWSPSSRDARHLTPVQYWHVAEQLRELARCKEPTKCPTQNIKKNGNFWQLADKGGPLGKINIRVFFIIEDSGQRKEIVVLGVHKKEQEGKLRQTVVVRINHRLREYKQGLAKQGGTR